MNTEYFQAIHLAELNYIKACSLNEPTQIVKHYEKFRDLLKLAEKLSGPSLIRFNHHYSVLFIGRLVSIEAFSHAVWVCSQYCSDTLLLSTRDHLEDLTKAAARLWLLTWRGAQQEDLRSAIDSDMALLAEASYIPNELRLLRSLLEVKWNPRFDGQRILADILDIEAAFSLSLNATEIFVLTLIELNQPQELLKVRAKIVYSVQSPFRGIGWAELVVLIDDFLANKKRTLRAI